MRLFSRLYDRVMVRSRHRHAPWYPGGLSFAGSSLMAWGGPAMEQRLRRYVDSIGWVMLALIALVLVLR